MTSGPAYSGYPSASIDSRGHIHLVWYGFDGTAYQVFYTHFNGNNWSAPIKLSEGFPDSVNPTIAVDSKDNLHVAWFKSNGRQYQIYYIRWSGSWSDQIVLSSGLTDSFNPSIAVDRMDRVYVVWDKGEAGRTQIYYVVYDDGTWTQQSPLTTDEVGSENPSVAVNNLGTVYVFYDKTDGQIYLRKFSGVLLPEERLTSSGENSYPSVRWSFNQNPFSDAGGRIDYVWTSKENGQVRVFYGQLGIERHSIQRVEDRSFLVKSGAAVTVVGVTLFLLFLYRRHSVGKRKP